MEEEENLEEILLMTINWKKLFAKSPFSPPKGILLKGESGTGKTRLVLEAARKLNANIIKLNGPDIFGEYVGDSEKILRDSFDLANSNSNSNSLISIIFIDNIVCFFLFILQMTKLPTLFYL